MTPFEIWFPVVAVAFSFACLLIQVASNRRRVNKIKQIDREWWANCQDYATFQKFKRITGWDGKTSLGRAFKEVVIENAELERKHAEVLKELEGAEADNDALAEQIEDLKIKHNMAKVKLAGREALRGWTSTSGPQHIECKWDDNFPTYVGTEVTHGADGFRPRSPGETLDGHITGSFKADGSTYVTIKC